MRATLEDLTHQRAAQILEDLGWDEFRAYVLTSARARAHEWRLRDLKTMPYREYLQTPEWHARAEEAYGRFGFRCALCNDDRDLNAHHRTSERRGCELDRRRFSFGLSHVPRKTGSGCEPPPVRTSAALAI